jgi:tetratricopeptide (TPR) repeat protein
MMPMHSDEERIALLLEGQLDGFGREDMIGEAAQQNGLQQTLANAAMILGDAAERSAGSPDPAPTPDPFALKPRRARRPRRRTPRRWCIPPAITTPHGESLEGVGILSEHTDQNLAHLLWNTLRDVTLWATADEDACASLFAKEAADARLNFIRDAALGPAMEVLLVSLAALVANPGEFKRDIASLLCVRASRWARDRGAIATSIAFAQAAALADPEDPGPALFVGVVVRKHARTAHELARAGTWLRRAIGLARRQADWLRYAEAYVELGALHAQQELRDSATRAYTLALRAARRHSHPEIRAAAFHGLMRLAVDAEEWELATMFGRAAGRAYGRGHAMQREVKLELAPVWTQLAQYERAITVLKREIPQRDDPVLKANLLAMLARSLAGAGEERRPEYQQAWSDCWSVINRPGSGAENHAHALFQLAHAAYTLKDWPRLDQAIRLQAAEPRHVNRKIAGQFQELLTVGRRPATE